jgi:hypothetical protein
MKPFVPSLFLLPKIESSNLTDSTTFKSERGSNPEEAKKKEEDNRIFKKPGNCE